MTFDKTEFTVIIAVGLLLGASFLFGLSLRFATLSRLGLWIEGSVFAKLSIYNAVKKLSLGLVGAEGDGVFKPAILSPAIKGDQMLSELSQQYGIEPVKITT